MLLRHTYGVLKGRLQERDIIVADTMMESYIDLVNWPSQSSPSSVDVGSVSGIKETSRWNGLEDMIGGQELRDISDQSFLIWAVGIVVVRQTITQTHPAYSLALTASGPLPLMIATL